MEVQVEILIQTITAQCGTLNPGDTLRTDAAFAAHLVDDCKAARYIPVSVPAVAEMLQASQEVEAAVDVQTSARADPYARLGTLIATVPGAADDSAAITAAAVEGDTGVQTSAQTDEQAAAAAAAVPKAPRKRAVPAKADEEG